jgi:5-methylcytosine-specific restriction protein A
VNRKQFIQSQGATCKNWTWSWSFVNQEKKFVIFGIWEDHIKEGKNLILGQSWERSGKGRIQPGYSQAIEHIDLIEKYSYELMTFSMEYSEDNSGDETAPAKIGNFIPKLTKMFLLKEDSKWYALDYPIDYKLAQEIDQNEMFVEGALSSITVNSFERDPVARSKCLEFHGYKCTVCDFDFEKFYGYLGKNYIQVHHITPLSEIRKNHEVNPVKDMVPVCPNCHAIIHRQKPALKINTLKEHIYKLRQHSN